MLPQRGRTQDTPDETLFAAITYVLVGGCAWRGLPPCFGISKSTAHRRFLIWSRAGGWGRPHEAVLHRLDDAGLIDVSRVVLDSAHVRARNEGELQVRTPFFVSMQLPSILPGTSRSRLPRSAGQAGSDADRRTPRH